MRYPGYALLLLLAATSAPAQRPIFDADDFVDPSLHRGPVFIVRIGTGATSNVIDDYRPSGKGAPFLYVANSLYWKRVEFDYKHSEVRRDSPPVQLCACQPPVVFPTPAPGDATPPPPSSRRKDTLQFGWYHDRTRHSITQRYRLTYSRQTIRTEIVSLATGKVESHLSGREQSFGVDADTYLPLRGLDLFGTLRLARTTQSGTAGDRDQTEFTYSQRFPGFSYKRVLFRTLLTAGGISNRGGTAINVVNPYFEAFFRENKTRVNFHLVYSPQMLNDGATGWETHHQVAVFADWGVVKVFGPNL